MSDDDRPDDDATDTNDDDDNGNGTDNGDDAGDGDGGDDGSSAALSADDTGLIANEKSITEAEIDNPEAFQDG